ncbi:MAG TPA: hypothetical protein V6C89_05035 [Drouetiella sp.]
MTYLAKEKSSFGKIFVALSLVTAIGFGLLYFMFGKSLANEGQGDAASNPTPSPAAVQTMSKQTHTHA